MRLLHFADLHIGMTNYSKVDPETGLESRLIDFFSTFDLIVATAEKEQVDAILFAGDMYKTRDPSPTQQRGVSERINKLAKIAPVILVVGNHDTPNTDGKANTLDIYSALEITNVHVIRKPELIDVQTKSGNLQVIGLPWLHKDGFKDLGGKISLMLDKLNKPPAGGPAVAVGHLEVEGATFGSEKGLAISSNVTTPLSLLTDRRLVYVALGHIHKHQVLSKDPLVIYSGSPERVDFGEEKEDKGFIVVDIKDKTVKYQFINTNARGFKTIIVDLQGQDPDPTQTILAEIKKHPIDNCIVRVIINIPADLEKELQMDQIKKALNAAHVIAGISRNIERKERVQLEGTEEVERLTPIQALHTYFQAKKLDPKKVAELEKYAKLLLEV